MVAQQNEPPNSSGSPNSRCPIIGVGASAGGLEAFSALLAHLPDHCEMSFVVVQHLDPHHVSKLTEILAKSTRMTVAEATDGMAVEPKHVYVIPPNSTLTIKDGNLQLSPRPEARTLYLPIDHFFKSLAQDCQTRAIGVVLSGTGSDGALGIEDIKAAGGITFAQDENSAKYGGMPQAAVRTGCIDFVLRPEEIARELVRIAQHPYVAPGPAKKDAVKSAEDEEIEYKRVLGLLRASFGVDFSAYRDTTIRRRIMRRMVLNTKDNLREYVQLLESNRTELESLYEDILINVTSFFREPETFEALKETVFPELMKAKSPATPTRIWVPGCSTGQEAYSLAIALQEFLEHGSLRLPIQIFATDLSDTVSLQKARDGVYPENIEGEVSPERLRRFFTKTDSKYRINKSIRDMIVFAKQNVAADPPFSRVDLISCRNLLIYLSPHLQKRIIPTFHYALNPNGYLLLGAAETIGSFTDLFSLIDPKHRIYSKRASVLRPYPHFQTDAFHAGKANDSRPQLPTPPTAPLDWQKEADRLVLGHYAPPGVLVNEKFDVLYFRGQTEAYLTPPTGEANLNIFRMAREGLLLDLRAALHEAHQKHTEVTRERIRIRTDNLVRNVNLRVLPIKLPAADDECFLVLFEESGPAARPAFAESTEPSRRPSPSPSRGGLLGWLGAWFRTQPERPPTGAPAGEAENQQLRQELVSTRDYLQSVIEQQDAANEELKSANEEILSSNEELQSTNEELETAKEELQSVNEELTTINEQLHNRNTELTRLNDDFTNLLTSANVPMLALGIDLRIRRFTPSAAKLLNLLPGDVGRPIGNLKPPVEIPDLEELITDVIETVQPRERDIRDPNGKLYALHIYPYRTAENKIDGAVIVLVDVTQQRSGEEARGQLASIVESSADAILGKSLDGMITASNRGAERLYGYSAKELVGKSIKLLIPADHQSEFAATIERIRRGEDVEPFETVRQCKDGSLIEVSVRVSPVVNSAGQIVAASDIARDITASKQLARQLKEADVRKNEFLAMLAHELRNPLAPLRTGLQILHTSGQVASESVEVRDMMERQVQHMSRLIDDLLDVSRITTGHIELRKERVDLNSVIREVAQNDRPQCDGAGLTVTLDLPTDPVFVLADPVRLAQIVDNLLTNAIKYSDHGGSITVKLLRERGQAVLRVTDTGIGIEPDMLPHIWELFTQADTSLGRSRSGLGIGLTLVRRLVEMHGGTAEAKSDGRGKGSEFTVRLPITHEAGEKKAAPRKAPQLTGRAILIVDDNSDAASTLAALLKLMGNDVQLASNGEQAIRLAGEQRPDIVLLDIGLPDIDGFQVAQRLRQMTDTDGMLLVAVTGYGSDDDRRRALTSGFDGLLVKPMDIRDLQELLAKIQ